MMYCINMVEFFFLNNGTFIHKIGYEFQKYSVPPWHQQNLTFTVFHANLEKIEKYLYKEDDMHLN